jgi:hypothetical protein
MVTAARITTLSAAGIILLGLLATIALPPMKPQDEEGVVQADPSPEAVLRSGESRAPPVATTPMDAAETPVVKRLPGQCISKGRREDDQGQRHRCLTCVPSARDRGRRRRDVPRHWRTIN